MLNLPIGHFMSIYKKSLSVDDIYTHTYFKIHTHCWNKAAASQIFPVDLILFLSDYCWKIVNILI